MRVANGFTFFYGSREPFSNWFKTRFVETEGPSGTLIFPTSEHYMMYRKAVHFADAGVAARILKTADPREAKRLGRKVSAFVAEEWSRVARTYVYRGCRLKFTQNPRALEALLATQGTQLVEASPSDRIWGVGLSERDDRILDRRNWQGTNWLGQVLTVLRDDLSTPGSPQQRPQWD
jgi:ribA/ribD-fused uncharacterized protein